MPTSTLHQYWPHTRLDDQLDGYWRSDGHNFAQGQSILHHYTFLVHGDPIILVNFSYQRRCSRADVVDCREMVFGGRREQMVDSRPLRSLVFINKSY